MAEEEDPWAEYREQLSRRADHYAHPGQTFLSRPVSARPLAASRNVGRPIRRPSKRAELLAKSREEAASAAAAPDRAAVVASPGSAARLRYHNASRLGRTGRRYRNHNNDPKIHEGVREFVRVMARGIKVYKYARNGVCSERILYLAENSVVWAKSRNSRRSKVPLSHIHGIRQGTSSSVFRNHLVKTGARLDPKACFSFIMRPRTTSRETLDLELPSADDCAWLLNGMRLLGIYVQEISSMRSMRSSNRSAAS